MQQSPTSINDADHDLRQSLAESIKDDEVDELPMKPQKQPEGGFKYVFPANAHRYESLDILAPESNAFSGMKYSKRIQFMNWVNFFLLGLFTGIIAFGMDQLEEFLVHIRWNWPQDIMDNDLSDPKKGEVEGGTYALAWFVYAIFSCFLVTLSATLSLYWAPGAIGSGVAETLAYVNGVNYTGLIGWPTLIVKALGVVFAVAGGIKVGKEGPLAHIGSVVGAIVLYLPYIPNTAFRNDRDKRIMVAAGAGVGVSVAFGAPIGGVLFAYEISKSNSFWTFGIAWRTFFATSIANFILTILDAIVQGDLGKVTNSGLLKFATINKNDYNLSDVIIFVIIGILGGVLGSLYIFINGNLLAKFRKYVLKPKYVKLIEAALFGFVGSSIVFFLPALFESQCSTPPGDGFDDIVHRYRCKASNEENPMATLFFSTEGDTVKFLLNGFSQQSAFNFYVSLCFFLVWFFFCAIEYGIAVPAGLFFPGLLIGASLGHFVALFLNKITLLNEANMINSMPTFAIVGGVSVLTGYTRLSFCLAVLLMETTQDVNLFIPMLIGVIFSRGIGNLIIPGLYVGALKLKGVPVISHKISRRAKDFRAEEVMVYPVVSFRQFETLETVFNTLMNCTHNGFPVINNEQEVVGYISRNFLSIIIKQRFFEGAGVTMSTAIDITRNRAAATSLDSEDTEQLQEPSREMQRLQSHIETPFNWTSFTETFKSSIRDISVRKEIVEENPQAIINLTRFMVEDPKVVTSNTTMWNCIKLFHAYSLRHLPVVDKQTNELVGIITRENVVAFDRTETIATTERNL